MLSVVRLNKSTTITHPAAAAVLILDCLTSLPFCMHMSAADIAAQRSRECG